MYKPKTNKKVIKIQAFLVIIFLGVTMLTVIGIGNADVAVVDNLIFTTLCFFNALVGAIIVAISILFVFIAFIVVIKLN